jgi:hypothetical protein
MLNGTIVSAQYYCVLIETEGVSGVLDLKDELIRLVAWEGVTDCTFAIRSHF